MRLYYNCLTDVAVTLDNLLCALAMVHLAAPDRATKRTAFTAHRRLANHRKLIGRLHSEAAASKPATPNQQLTTDN